MYVRKKVGFKIVNKQYCCREFFEQSIKSFLSIHNNFHLFKQSICHPTIENQMLLDQSFKTFYFYIRFTAYLSSTIYYHAINFDKKDRQTNYRFPVTQKAVSFFLLKIISADS